MIWTSSRWLINEILACDDHGHSGWICGFFGELRKIQGHFREQHELFDLRSGEVSTGETGEMFSSAPTLVLIGETMKHGLCLIDWQYRR